MQTLREKKTTLTQILSADISFVLQYVQQEQLITDREYKNLNVPSHSNEQISINLLDKLMDKGEETCQKFISLMKEPNIVATFPKLKDLFPTQSAELRQEPSYQEVTTKLKSSLKKKYERILHGNSITGHTKFLNDIYTDLYIVEDETGGVIHEHEIMQAEASIRRFTTEETPITCSDIFKVPSDPGRRNRKVLTMGIAGVGKTVSVNKFILDWAEEKSNQDIDFIFPLLFRELNSHTHKKKYSLIELLHEYFEDSAELQSLPEGDGKVMFIFDGLDECRFPLDFTETEKLKKINQNTSLGTLITNLIKENLFPSALIWITSRPAAAHQIPRDYIHQVTEVRGFSDEQKEEYFKKYNKNQDTANKMISHIKKSRSLHIMCHIPVFCWISATVLQPMLAKVTSKELPTTLTGMYTQFLIFQIHQMTEKKGAKKISQIRKQDKAEKIIKKLGKLAFYQLEKGNLIFYKEDLRECGIDVSEASVYSGVCTQIFSQEQGVSQTVVFSFVHLSVQEFLAAVHVYLSHHYKRKNPLHPSTIANRFKWLFKSTEAFYESAIDKALESQNGHLDLFLRFLHGLSLESNQRLLKELLPQTAIRSQSVEKTVNHIKKTLNSNISSERSINLLYCLNELQDDSLVNEIQKYLGSGHLSTEKLSSAQWSALVFVLLMSEETEEKFELKKYRGSDEGLKRLLPVLKNTKRALLAGCKLTEQSCSSIASVLQSVNCPLTELDLSNNDLQDSGVKFLCVGLKNQHCKLEILRLVLCKLTEQSCSSIASVLQSVNCPLRELDLSNNDLQDSGVKFLCVGLKNPHCKLEILRLSGCLVREKGCCSLASALSSNPSHLRELDLSYNHPGDSGVKRLSTQMNQHCRLKSVHVDHGGEFRIKPGLRKYACDLTLNPNTAHTLLSLSEGNRKVTYVRENQSYPDHPERFDYWEQVICKESLTGRCYWETERSGDYADVSVTYKGIGRKGGSDDCRFGLNEKSWSLCYRGNSYSARHNNQRTALPHHPSHTHRVGVYLDWSSGTVSFYSVSSDTHTLTHLHTFYCTFTEPLYAGFRVYGSSVSLYETDSLYWLLEETLIKGVCLGVAAGQDSLKMQARHDKTLSNMYNTANPKPNQSHVAPILDLKFEARLAFIASDAIREEGRATKIFEAYL
ncbi:NLR family CARD domain-containing protein 3-like [Chanos chanos]|uniref:NLR family CARD domain-containing protein 3-like n=1 Tax=Chanos chanos TaxID=29144 RepID=A0A6J2WAX3_CHACN|nr:NLR family CARD domain-containing protein 3-like [Chanos chanos]